MTRPALDVGFLVDTLAEDYQYRIFSGFNDEAARLNISVTCFVGGSLVVSGPEVHRNRIYECISSSNLDALVVVTGAIGNKVSGETLAAFIESYRPLPICTIGVELPGVHSITVDNRTGTRQALMHLIQEMGRRRIAFIRGPEHSREAEERFLEYQAALREHGIAPNSDLVTFGDFQVASGAQAITTLVDERHMGFDAVMAANDAMALGAMNALIERGVSIPQRVAIVGFDDIEPARFAALPLSTVRQPLRELGRLALENVIAQVHNNNPSEHTVLATELVPRQSTKKRETEVHRVQHGSQADVVDSVSFETAFQRIRTGLLAELRGVLPECGLDRDWPEQLTSALVSEVAGRRAGLLRRVTFVEYMEQILFRVAASDHDTTSCQELISVLRARLLPLVRHVGNLLENAEDLFHEGRMLCGSIAERYQVQQRLQAQHWRRSIQELGMACLRCETVEQVEQLLSQELPHFGIPSGLICAFEEAGMSRTLGGFEMDRTFGRQPSLPMQELRPGDLLDDQRRRTLILESLYLRDRSLGYAAFEVGPLVPELYELLRDFLTGALRGLLAQPSKPPPPQ